MATIKKMVAKKAPKKYATGGSMSTTSTNTTKKPKSVSETIGNITLRDVKNAGEDALQIATLGAYGKVKKAFGGKYKYKKIGERKNGGKVTKAKSGTSLKPVNSSEKPGLAKLPTAVRNKMGYQKNGGKVKAKSGMKVAKCKSGCK